MVEDSVLKAVRAAVQEVVPGVEVSDDTPLIARRIVDSLSLLSLVSLLEERLPVTIRDSELLPANFETVVAIRAFLKSKGC
ncbi:phosphopantetheine-binding protein [Streptomyces blastmyceticus]|uniref:Carrier domain-containing protein n=1 Tax=Streptomyces blastmyceticus TaxID=68180 RepID=A0ABP3G2B4_9ACTN